MAAHAKICISTAAALFGHATQPALAQPPTDQFSCMSFLWGGGWGHMFFGGFMMLVFWAGLIALIVLAVRWVSSGSPGGASRPASSTAPKQILEERFAKGEIDKNEFEERKKTLAV